jgi:hypothetical protein
LPSLSSASVNSLERFRPGSEDIAIHFKLYIANRNSSFCIHDFGA